MESSTAKTRCLHRLAVAYHRLMRLTVGFLVLIGIAGIAAPAAHANGRFPITVNVKFRPGATETVLVPASFGLMISKDGGDTFRWVCELAIGYTGTYDPDYAVTADGEIYATTFEGLRVSRDDGCTWESLGAPLDVDTFIADIQIGADGRIWAATASGGATNDVYVSSDGETFAGAGLESMNWWLSVATTPADPKRIYVTGYQPNDGIRGLLRRKTTAGGDWESLPLDDINFGEGNPFFYIVGVSPTNEDIVFGRAEAVNPPVGDALYRSVDGGQNWTKVLDFRQNMTAFTIRSDGQTVIAGSVSACLDDPVGADKGCVRISHDAGETWAPTAAQPQMQCVGERSDGTLFACGANFAPDMFAIGTSQDGESWETLWRFADMEDPSKSGPLECPADTEQASQCVANYWPSLVCGLFMFDLPICVRGDAGPMANDAGPAQEESGGRCRVGRSAASGFALPLLMAALGVLFIWRRPRRRT